MAVATDGCNVIGRHNFLAQKLEAEIVTYNFVSMVSMHCHAHPFASTSYYTTADLYTMLYETAVVVISDSNMSLSVSSEDSIAVNVNREVTTNETVWMKEGDTTEDENSITINAE